MATPLAMSLILLLCVPAIGKELCVDGAGGCMEEAELLSTAMLQAHTKVRADSSTIEGGRSTMDTPQGELYEDSADLSTIEDGSALRSKNEWALSLRRKSHSTTAPPTTTSTAPGLPDYCYIKSYGRGVGSIPDKCPSNMEYAGGPYYSCYPKCADGYTKGGRGSREGRDCFRSYDGGGTCPQGWFNEPLTCRAGTSNRPLRYVGQAGRRRQGGRRRRGHGCNTGECRANRYGNKDETWGNYCILSAYCGMCELKGLGTNTVGSCWKFKPISMAGKNIKPSCGGDKPVKSGGLCYKACREGYSDTGGPICWGEPPPGMVKCGIGAAISKAKCLSVTAKMVYSPLAAVASTAALVVTLGGSGGLVAGAKVAAKETAKTAIKSCGKAMDEAKKGEVPGAIATMTNFIDDEDQTDAEKAKFALEMAALVDPTGLADAAASYTWDKCSALGIY